MVPLSIQRRDFPKTTGIAGSSLAVQLGFLLEHLLILSVFLAGGIGGLLSLASSLFLLLPALSDLFKQLFTLRFGLLADKRGKGSGCQMILAHRLLGMVAHLTVDSKGFVA